MAADQKLEELPVINSAVRFHRGLLSDFKQIFRFRELLFALISREFRTRYKGAKLGWVWALVRPLVMFSVYGLAVGVFLGAGQAIPAFGIYLYVGLIGWNLFAQIVTSSTNAIVGNADLIKKASFPRELLIIAVTITALVDFAIQSLVLIPGYLIYNQAPALPELLWIIPGLAIMVIFGMSLGLVLAVANAKLRDVGFLTDVGLQVGFWLTPIVYPYTAVMTALANFPAIQHIYLLNPVTNAIFMFRKALWPQFATSDEGLHLGQEFSAIRVTLVIVVGLGLLGICQRIFATRSVNVAQEI